MSVPIGDNDVPEKSIDMHQHIYSVAAAGVMAEEYHRLGVERAVLLGLPPSREPGNNEIVLAASKKHPDLYIPFAGPDMDGATPDDITRFHDEGFVGLKFIAPTRPYNDPGHFPLYERACELKMPVLFHLGVIANKPGWTDCDSNLMRPIYLDHIARSLPQLTIVGAHLGNPWYEEATMPCRWNPNLFFDLSGSTLKKKSPEFIGGLLWWRPDSAYRSPDGTSAWQKIVYGSDVPVEQIADVIHDYENLMDSLQLSPEIRRQVWHDTAARLLGLEE